MRTMLSWSSGKDSAWTLHVLREMPRVEVVGLFTTLNTAFDRVAMHGVRREVVMAQAEAAGLPIHVIDIPYPCPNEVYEKSMVSFVSSARRDGVEAMAFGDLFLEDIRAYREGRLAGTGITPLFPLWGRNTHELARAMVAGGLEARIVCLDPSRVDRGLAGSSFDAALLAKLPSSADPCGELGEFHTCVLGGPMFSRRLHVVPGEVVERDGFVFSDLRLGP